MADKKLSGNVLKKTCSKDLLYTEYTEVNATERAIVSLQRESKTCPDFTFCRSSILAKARNFLPLLEKAQKDLETKSPSEYNIEDIDKSKHFIEMNVQVIKDLDVNLEENSDEESNDNLNGDAAYSSESEDDSDAESVENKKLSKNKLIEEI